MAVMTESWNEQRLDDLNGRVEAGFDRLDKRIDESATRLDKRIDDLRIEMNAGFEQMRAEFGALQRTLLQVGGGLIGTVIAATTAIVIAVA